MIRYCLRCKNSFDSLAHNALYCHNCRVGKWKESINCEDCGKKILTYKFTKCKDCNSRNKKKYITKVRVPCKKCGEQTRSLIGLCGSCQGNGYKFKVFGGKRLAKFSQEIELKKEIFNFLKSMDNKRFSDLEYIIFIGKLFNYYEKLFTNLHRINGKPQKQIKIMVERLYRECTLV